MTREELRDVLDFAVEVAWRAGRTTLAHYQTGITAETKPDDSPVTAADRAAEQIARELIGKRFPADAILGEEVGLFGPGAPVVNSTNTRQKHGVAHRFNQGAGRGGRRHRLDRPAGTHGLAGESFDTRARVAPVTPFAGKVIARPAARHH